MHRRGGAARTNPAADPHALAPALPCSPRGFPRRRSGVETWRGRSLLGVAFDAIAMITVKRRHGVTRRRRCGRCGEGGRRTGAAKPGVNALLANAVAVAEQISDPGEARLAVADEMPACQSTSRVGDMRCGRRWCARLAVDEQRRSPPIAIASPEPTGASLRRCRARHRRIATEQRHLARAVDKSAHRRREVAQLTVARAPLDLKKAGSAAPRPVVLQGRANVTAG